MESRHYRWIVSRPRLTAHLPISVVLLWDTKPPSEHPISETLERVAGELLFRLPQGMIEALTAMQRIVDRRGSGQQLATAFAFGVSSASTDGVGVAMSPRGQRGASQPSFRWMISREYFAM